MDCIIFDLDGTLVDSEPACNQAFLDLLPDLRDDVVELTARYRGRRLHEILYDLEVRLGRKLPQDFEHNYRARVNAIFDDELQAMPEAEEALSAATTAMCVASNGPATKIRRALDLTGLSRFFGDRVFSSYDVGFWKPDPRLFLHAARTMGFAPDRCIVVEDSSVGITAAIAAGMQPIQYLPHGGRSVDGVAVIRDLRELLDVQKWTQSH